MGMLLNLCINRSLTVHNKRGKHLKMQFCSSASNQYANYVCSVLRKRNVNEAMTVFVPLDTP